MDWWKEDAPAGAAWWGEDEPANLEQSLGAIYKESTRADMEAEPYPWLMARAVNFGAGISAPLHRLVGDDLTAAQTQAYAGAVSEHARTRAERITNYPGIAKAVAGVGDTLPAAYAGGSIAGPVGAIGQAAVSERDSSYHDARVAGLPEPEAARFANEQGIIEGGVAGGFQLVGLGGLEKMFGGQAAQQGVRAALTEAGKRTLSELAEEELTSILQAVNASTKKVGPQATPKQLFEVAKDTALQTLLTMGAAETINAASPRKLPAQAATPVQQPTGEELPRVATQPTPVSPPIEIPETAGSPEQEIAPIQESRDLPHDTESDISPAQATATRIDPKQLSDQDLASRLAELETILDDLGVAAPEWDSLDIERQLLGHELKRRTPKAVNSDTVSPDLAEVMPAEAVAAPEPIPPPPPSGRRLWREIAMDDLEEYLPGGNTSGGYTFGAPQLFMADNPDLALGQGKNQGVVVEFDADKVRDRDGHGPVQHSKPGTELPGVGKEWKIKATPDRMAEALTAFTIKPGAKVTGPNRIRLGRFFEKSLKWTKETLADGAVLYSRPGSQSQLPPEKQSETVIDQVTAQINEGKKRGTVIVTDAAGKKHRVRSASLGKFYTTSGKALPLTADLKVEVQERGARRVGQKKARPSVESALADVRAKLEAGTLRPFGDRETPSDYQPLIDAVVKERGVSPGEAMSVAQELISPLPPIETAKPVSGSIYTPGNEPLKVISSRGQTAIPGLEEEAGSAEARDAEAAKYEPYLERLRQIGGADWGDSHREILAGLEGRILKILEEDDIAPDQVVDYLSDLPSPPKSVSTSAFGDRLSQQGDVIDELSAEVFRRIKPQKVGGISIGQTVFTPYGDEGEVVSLELMDTDGRFPDFVAKVKVGDKVEDVSPSRLESKRAYEEKHVKKATEQGRNRYENMMKAAEAKPFPLGLPAPNIKKASLKQAQDFAASYGVVINRRGSIKHWIERGLEAKSALERGAKQQAKADPPVLKKPTPTKAKPGTPEKIEEMRRRVEAGEEAMSEEDATDSIPTLSVRTRKTLSKPLTRAGVASVFPGAVIKARPSGWQVEIGQSFIDIENTRQIELDWNEIETRLGRAVPPQMRSKIAAAGQYTVTLDDGTKHTGLGLIRLAEGLANVGTLRHEALHLARKAGILTEPEYETLRAELGRGTENPNLAEEFVAEAQEAEPKNLTLWEKVQSWFRRLLNGLGITQQTAADIQQLMTESGFWQREGKRPGGGAFSLGYHDQQFKASLPVEVDLGNGNVFHDEVKGLNRGHALWRARQNWPDAKSVLPSRASDVAMQEEIDREYAAAEKIGRDMAYEGVTGRKFYQLVGRPDLANPATDQEARDLVDQADEQRNEAGEPRQISDEAVRAASRGALDRDFAGERKKLLAAGASGAQLSDVDTVSAKEIINREAAQAVKSGNSQVIRDAINLIDAYRRTGASQARGFRQRRDPVENPAQRMARQVVEAILTPPKKTREKIERAREAGDEAAAQAELDAWAKKFKGLKKQLKELGVDLDNLNELGYSKIRAAQAISIIAAAKHDAWDVAYEYWRNAILSSPKTQVANILGNLGHAAWHFTAERLVEAGLNQIIGRPEGAQLGELTHLYAGILPGLSKAARNFTLTFQTEMPQFDPQLGRAGQFRHESADVAIAGTTGRVVRTPQRMLLAVDDFAKTLFANMEVGANAYRLAKAEGLEGAEMQARIQALMADIESPAWDAAYDSALELTFQQRGGDIAMGFKRAALMLRRDWRPLQYVIPFVTTPVNIFETAVKKSPLGLFGLGRSLWNNYKAGKPIFEGQTSHLAQQVLVWSVILALLQNDEEDPWITGAESEFSPDTRELARRTGRQPQSVKIGDRWYSYARLEPFATILSLATDWTNAIKSENPDRLAGTLPKSVIGQVKDKTFLNGVSDILKAAEAEDPAEKVAKWASEFTVSWVPNLVRTGGRATEENFDEMRVWGDGTDWWKMLAKRTAQRTEVLPVGEFPNYDLWGREQKTSTSPVPYTDWVYRMTAPSDSRLENIHPGDRLLLAWNNQNPDKPIYPSGTSFTYQKDGEKRVLTDEQFAQLSKLSGQIASRLVAAEKWNFETPQEDEIERLGDLVQAGRAIAKDRLIPAWESGAQVTEPTDAELKTAVEGHQSKQAVTAARGLLSYRPKSTTPGERAEGVTLARKIELWKAERDEARKALMRNPLGKEAVSKAVRSWIKSDIKDRQAEQEKIARFKSILGW